MENDAPHNSPIFACVFVAMVTILPRLCLATTGGIHIETRRQIEGFMQYAVEMGSGVMIYIPRFIKVGSGIQNLIWGNTKNTQTAW
jgi:hypothetical protein